MNRRTFLSAVVIAPVVAAIAACGDPDQSPAEADPTNGGSGPATGIAHPTGSNDVVLELSYEGGFVPAGTAFVNTPSLLVSGDGRLFTPGIIPMIYPGPLLPAINVRTISEDGIQSMLAIPKSSGLFAEPPDYAGGDNVADAPNTVLAINADGGNFVHSAYALGIDSPESSARQKLLDATTALSDLETAAGAANLGPEEPFVPAEYRFQARVVDPSELTDQDPAPTVVDWPATLSFSLAGATECSRLSADAVGSLFADAKQNTYFTDGDVVYQLTVAGVLPGDAAC